MTATTKIQLGGDTTTRKWYLDVDTTPNGPSSTWVPVLGISNFAPVTDDANLEDDSDFDGGGGKSMGKTATGFSATCTVVRKVTAADSTQYDAGQEYLRSKSIGQLGLNAVVHVRFYEMEPNGPRIEAYAGEATVSWAEQGGPMTALSTVQVTLTGRGVIAQIDHPETAADVVAVLHSVSPSAAAAAGGTLVEIVGTGFDGTTGITLGGTAFTAFHKVSDSIIVGVTPAKSAGTYPVVVTNGVGPSTVNVSITTS